MKSLRFSAALGGGILRLETIEAAEPPSPVGRARRRDSKNPLKIEEIT